MIKVTKIPNGWQKTYLGEIFEFKNGVNAEKSSYGHGIKFINVMDVFQGNFIIAEKIIGQISLSDKKIKENLVIEGDVLFNRTSEIPEEIAMTSVYLGNEEVVFGGFVIKGHPKDDSLDNMFKKYCFFSENVRKEIIRRGQGAVRINIGQKDLSKVPILLPQLPEQKAIADFLSIWDEAIDKTERLIQKKEKRFKELQNRLIYLPTVNEKWKQVQTKFLFKERRETKRDGLPLLSITNGEGIIPRHETNRKDTSKKDKSKYLRICPGDIGYNTMRMWQGVSALSTLEGIISPAYTICTPGEKLFPKFVASLFKMPFMIHRFYRYSQGLTSDTWNLKYPNFCEVKMPLPPIKEQQQIAETLSTALHEIDLHKQLAEQYNTQKRGLMQKMLTGEWRVKPEILNKYREA